MVVVEPVVNEEKLRQLLDEQAESPALDYKSACNLDEKRDLVELTKDIGAMQIDGGFIVIGADDHGNPTGQVTEADATLFDEARLRPKLNRYMDEPLDIISSVHVIDGNRLVLLYVGPNRRGWCIFKANGAYEGPRGQVTVFRQGDVFARHGTASERWRQGDIERIRRRLIEDAKDEWRQGFAQDLSRMTQSQRIAKAPSGALNWQLDIESFLGAVQEQLRTGDDIPLRLLLEKSSGDALRFLAEPESLDDLRTLLDRLMCLSAEMLVLERADWFDKVLGAFVRIYSLPFDERGSRRRDLQLRPEQLWLMIVERLIALGGLAVRREDWQAVKSLILRRAAGPEFREEEGGYTTLIRHALTMAARAQLLTEEVPNGQRRETPLLSLALTHIREHECVRRDLLPDDERLLTSLCQFDFLAALVAIGDARDTHTGLFYTNFARFYGFRTEPIVVRLLEDEEMRSILFPLDNAQLAIGLRVIDEMAQQEGFRYSGWHRYQSRTIREFLEENTPKEG